VGAYMNTWHDVMSICVHDMSRNIYRLNGCGYSW